MIAVTELLSSTHLKTMNIQPLNDRIAVREIKPSDISSGGIYIGEFIDDGLTKEIVHGEVIAVGPGLINGKGMRESMWGIKPGDIVGYSPVCSVTQNLDNVPVTIIRRDAVVGVVPKVES